MDLLIVFLSFLAIIAVCGTAVFCTAMVCLAWKEVANIRAKEEESTNRLDRIGFHIPGGDED